MKNYLILFICILGFFANSQTSPITLDAIVGSARASSFTVPCGVTSITVHTWGGGGGGGGRGNTNGESGGGGGGAYASIIIAVTPGQVYDLQAGSGGSGGIGFAVGSTGGDSFFKLQGAATNLALAKGGGSGSSAGFGLGGTSASSIGTTKFSGGNASPAISTTSGGGGGSGASSTDNGLSATTVAGGASVASISGVGMSGGAGGNGGIDANGGNASSRSGGGGGAHRSSGNRDGGNGSPGRVLIVFTANSNTGCDPCSAIPISSLPYTHTSTTIGGFNFMNGGCHGNVDASFGGGNDKFYAVTVAANSYLTIQLTGTTGAAGMYQELSVLSGACTGPWACHTNGAWGGGLQAVTTSYAATTQSPCRTVFFPTAGTYYLRVDGDVGDNGPYTLNVSSYTQTVGDNCATSVPLASSTPITINSTNCIYTQGSDDPTQGLFCAGTVENTNWLHFQSDGSGSAVNVNISGVTCNLGYWNGASGVHYSASGQFGIVKSSTSACGGTYSAVAGVPCASVPNAGTYSNNLPNSSVTDYYLIWDGNGGAECNYTIAVTNVNLLPVELKYFDAEEVNGNVYLNWVTYSERENDYFIVERSHDGINFEFFAMSKGKGTTSSTSYYEILDENPLSGISYYRLKQVDFNGKIADLGISTIKLLQSKFDLVLYPNPSLNGSEVNLQINSLTNSQVQISVSNLEGKKIFGEELKVIPGENHFEINHFLPAGIYLVNSKNREGVEVNKRLIVQ
jgi:hypothetical protein